MLGARLGPPASPLRSSSEGAELSAGSVTDDGAAPVGGAQEAAATASAPSLPMPSIATPSTATPSTATPSTLGSIDIPVTGDGEVSQTSPLAAIGDLVGRPRVPATGAAGPKVALAVPYAEPELPGRALPSIVPPRAQGENRDPAASVLAPLAPDIDLTMVRPGDFNPAFAPLPASIAPPDADQARLSIAAYRKGDTGLGDAYATGVTTEAARVALEWVAMRADPRGSGYSRMAAFLKAHPDWPSATWLRRRSEEALYAGKQDYSLLAAYFARTQPEGPAGKLALARLDRRQGSVDEATALVREVWRVGDISQSLESKVLAEFGDLLTPGDHKFRADRAFYDEETGRLMRAAALVGGDEVALAKAQVAVVDGAGNAEAMLAALPLKLKSDPSFIFARIQLLRRAEKADKLEEAAKLMLSAPRDADDIVDGDAWWIERRLIARKLLDAGDAEIAYQICAEHGASSAEMRIEAAFHAGWIALRFLKNPTLAAPHFAVAGSIAAMPPSVARAAYWQGRTAQALGDEEAATASFAQAAAHVTTYYGQLARAKLGLTDLPLRQTRLLATGDERDLAIRVAEFLYALGETDYALPLVTDAAKRLADEGQMAALGKVVETGRDARAVLILGKLATQRGLPLDNFAFPIFGVPYYEPVANSADKTIVYAIARQESAFAPTATSTAGAKGLMQLMPDTARRTAQHVGIALDVAKLNTDAALNARIGAAHLGELFAEQGGSYILTFAAYNAGGKRVKEWIAAHGDPRRAEVDPVDWIERIPITETRDYVQRIIENMQVYRSRFGEASRPINEAELRKRGGG